MSMIRSVTLALCLLTITSGCGGSKSAEVGGTVTHANSPIPNLLLHFVSDKGTRSSGLADAQGKFNLVAGPEGLIPGNYKVWVQLPTNSPRDEQSSKGIEKSQSDPVVQAILQKYGKLENTPLAIEVKKGKQVIEVKLD